MVGYYPTPYGNLMITFLESSEQQGQHEVYVEHNNIQYFEENDGEEYIECSVDYLINKYGREETNKSIIGATRNAKPDL